ncbi:NF038129 family PEP-CTERM protein [Massilia sp. BJB1822]|uniref:NF038129 family PEP-CTERM protein n=1 Tax=Massilia sp. BJB1822 TaxID=2744470 RepID=UPI0015937D91|nr:NF038129 family PEP-CTERM protein [Massilia sp. BJB1822]NVD99983.1 PEP-CTERM sorting domain-containing protein [Massilia sp. BJB1822]
MFKTSTFSLRQLARQAVAAVTLALLSGLAAAGTLSVSIDTRGFGSNGWLDFQFNPAGTGLSPAATARLSNFRGFDAGAATEVFGDVSGSLASGYVLRNSGSWNDLFHAVNFGGLLRFDLSIGGDADLSGSLNQSAFAVSAYAADKVTLLGNPAGIDGSLVSFAWTPGSAVGAAGRLDTTLSSAAASVSQVPEPSMLVLTATGLLLITGMLRRRKPWDGDKL